MTKTRRQRVASILGDVHAYGGALMVAAGAGWAWSPPAGLMVFGGFLALVGLFWRGGKTE